ncbi:MAG: diguanylate cyclase [Candidatus Paralactobacillus gallistercoris]|uniref:Diguanylate cyclase n=1 Tax=Candidatus Paralactobacillus gallistercoris TaxID=2838724 RepID=A0A948TIE4_9LACO|nr:diguanylate cyclase [Candidatus Paralactobacillus gallistercoris]
MKNKRPTNSFLVDVFLLIFLLLFFVTAVFMSLNGRSVLINAFYLGITAFLILLTYFLGLTTGLIINLLFVVFQGGLLTYLAVFQKRVDVATGDLAFWLFMPLLLSMSFYGMAYYGLQLQAENRRLKDELVHQSVLDSETNLRTLVAYLRDTQIFTKTAAKYQLPLSMMTIKIRYFNEIRRILDHDQLDALVRLVSRVILSSDEGLTLAYLLSRDNLTWGALLFVDAAEARETARKIKTKFAQELPKVISLHDIDISLVIGVAEYDPKKMKDGHDLEHAATHMIQYDVGNDDVAKKY